MEVNEHGVGVDKSLKKGTENMHADSAKMIGTQTHNTKLKKLVYWCTL